MRSEVGYPQPERPDGVPRGLAVVLPGRQYPLTAPILAAVRPLLIAHGYLVQPVAWELAELPADPDAWIAERLAETLDRGRDALADSGAGVSGGTDVLIVGKSLGTRASIGAAAAGYPGLWLTPLLTDPGQVAAIEANPARQLLVGGAADPFWDGAVAAGLAGDRITVVELPDADHGLQVADDPRRTDRTMAQLVAAVDDWLGDRPRDG